MLNLGQWLCGHRRELPARDEAGVLVLRCADCFRVRPHILATTEPPKFRSVLSALEKGPSAAVETGIEREALREAEEARAVDAAMAELERRERRERAKVAAIRRWKL